jgi:predicted ATPase
MSVWMQQCLQCPIQQSSNAGQLEYANLDRYIPHVRILMRFALGYRVSDHAIMISASTTSHPQVYLALFRRCLTTSMQRIYCVYLFMLTSAMSTAILRPENHLKIVI